MFGVGLYVYSERIYNVGRHEKVEMSTSEKKALTLSNLPSLVSFPQHTKLPNEPITAFLCGKLSVLLSLCIIYFHPKTLKDIHSNQVEDSNGCAKGWVSEFGGSYERSNT
ncbi:hypothetical protein Lal_00011923 [Lupinus albus]|nr:hypothetical protein Lal_00011923 [Lupinus albus]